MVYEERNTWAGLIVMAVVLPVYVIAVLQAAGGGPLEEVDWVPLLLWAIGGGILGTIVLSILWGILAGMRDPEGVGRSDQRDRDIARMGDRVGQAFTAIGGSSAPSSASLTTREWGFADFEATRDDVLVQRGSAWASGSGSVVSARVTICAPSGAACCRNSSAFCAAGVSSSTTSGAAAAACLADAALAFARAPGDWDGSASQIAVPASPSRAIVPTAATMR